MIKKQFAIDVNKEHIVVKCPFKFENALLLQSYPHCKSHISCSNGNFKKHSTPKYSEKMAVQCVKRLKYSTNLII